MTNINQSVMSRLFAINLDRDIRTDDRAQGAPSALAPPFVKAYRSVSTGIVLPRGGDQSFFAGLNAKMAFLTELFVDCDISLQLPFLLKRAIPPGQSSVGCVGRRF
jgi:hypothetical protein